MKNIVQNSVENSVRNMVKGKRKQHGEKFLPTWRYCSAWGVPDEYTLLSLSKHKLTDSHTGHTHTPHWQQPLCTTHTHTHSTNTPKIAFQHCPVNDVGRRRERETFAETCTWRSQRPSACTCCWQPHRCHQSHPLPRHPATAGQTQEAFLNNR